jgi:hypothetical protein
LQELAAEYEALAAALEAGGRQANVRRTGATDGIDELATSIAAHGLLSPAAFGQAAAVNSLFTPLLPGSNSDPAPSVPRR